MTQQRIHAGALDVAYEDSGASSNNTAFLLHGFPYDIHTYDEVTPILTAAGCRVVVPYLRGFGPTRFLAPSTMRSGQQAVLAHDLLALMDALGVQRAVLAGYDWGGRAACIVSALWPQRAQGLVTGAGYNVHDIPGSRRPGVPEDEHRYWYQYYFHGERGRAGLEQNRYALCKLLWKLWSPNWKFDEQTYARSAVSFDNPDFVEVVIHSYRHRYGLVSGDPAVEETERRLEAQPRIGVPTICMDGGGDGVRAPEGSVGHERHFNGRYERRVVPLAGHNVPQEAPQAFAQAVLDLAYPTE
ncbi:MAG: alpha/beta hydrolase [Casimicrobiaceae bacterium]